MKGFVEWCVTMVLLLVAMLSLQWVAECFGYTLANALSVVGNLAVMVSLMYAADKIVESVIRKGMPC